jgi:hypothetical protein
MRVAKVRDWGGTDSLKDSNCVQITSLAINGARGGGEPVTGMSTTHPEIRHNIYIPHLLAFVWMIRQNTCFEPPFLATT